MRYQKSTGTNAHAYSTDFTDPEQADTHLWLRLPTGIGWRPDRLEVNGRKGRRVVCVFAEDKFHYRIFDLDGTDEPAEDADANGEDDTVMRD